MVLRTVWAGWVYMVWRVIKYRIYDMSPRTLIQITPFSSIFEDHYCIDTCSWSVVRIPVLC